MSCGKCNGPLNHWPVRMARANKRIRMHTKVILVPIPRAGQGAPLGILICGHLFHKACLINHWYCGNTTCPTCLVEFNLRQVWNATLPPMQISRECCCSVHEELNRKKDDIQHENRELEEKLEELKKQNAHLKDAAKNEAKRVQELEKSPARKIFEFITPWKPPDGEELGRRKNTYTCWLTIINKKCLAHSISLFYF